MYNTEMTNADRAERAKRALVEYVNGEGREADVQQGEPQNIVEAAGDMLCDLLHLVNQKSPGDVHYVHRVGWAAYQDELREEEAVND